MTLRDFLADLTSIRQRLHAIPEIGLAEFETSNLIAECLSGWGLQVHRGFAKTGLVGRLQRGNSRRAIGFRADFDALPIAEETGLPYSSKHPGMMHACGHDGHTAMLMGAAWMLSQRSDLDGSVNFVFQPAEENYGGGKLMIEDGLFEAFPCDRIYAVHNLPGLSAGTFATRSGPITASVDVVKVVVHGKGGHGAMPAKTTDPVVAGASIVMALQTVLSRNIDAHDAAVITVGAFHAGGSSTIIPDTAVLEISMRALSPSTRTELRERVESIASMQAAAFGATTTFEWDLGYPVTINEKEATSLAEKVIVDRFGSERLLKLDTPQMFSEDFSFMLEKVPGAYVLIGNGDSAPLHSSSFDFNDELLEPGALFFHDLAVAHLQAQP